MSDLRELRYLRRRVEDLDAARRFVTEEFALMPEDRDDTQAWFRADRRFYSLALGTALPDAIGFSVGRAETLEEIGAGFIDAGHAVAALEGPDAARRGIKRGIAVTAPSGVTLEVVWRHLESGRPYHGARDTGLGGFAAVQIASPAPAEDAAFFALAGLTDADYLGDARFLTVGDTHHQIAIYPSARAGLIGATWQVETVDHVMRAWHTLRDRQVPVAHGPGRQPTSGARFVTVRAPDGFLMTYATAMDAPCPSGPRQFSDAPASHCAWGSPTDVPEFGGEDR